MVCRKTFKKPAFLDVSSGDWCVMECLDRCVLGEPNFNFEGEFLDVVVSRVRNERVRVQVVVSPRG